MSFFRCHRSKGFDLPIGKASCRLWQDIGHQGDGMIKASLGSNPLKVTTGPLIVFR